MSEYVAQMGPMLILAGIAAGWVSEAMSRARGYGFITDMTLGLIGSLVAGLAMSLFISREAGMIVMFLVGCAGAAVVIGGQRQVWRSARLGT
jgi:uncharacterized membrane protein YeaQ/YmgE (transglycosylase-associated protein family)